MRQRDERVPGSKYGEEVRLPERPMVHFDLDPQNGKWYLSCVEWLGEKERENSVNLKDMMLTIWDIVLIGDFGEAGEAHSNMPIFKVADPGLSEVVEDHTRMSE